MIPTRWSALILFAVCSLPAFAATSLTSIVSERSAVILSVEDVPSVVERWDEGPWSRTWNDEQVKRYFAPLRTQMKIEEWDAQAKEKTGYTVRELLGFATGDAILVLPNFDFAKIEDSKEVPPLLIAIDVGANAAKIEQLFAKAAKEKNQTEETVEFSGVTVHILPPKEGADANQSPTVWALVDGKWLISPKKEVVFSAIDAVKSGGVADAWSRSERHAQLKKRVGDAHLTFVVNVEAFYPALRDSLIARSKARGEQASGPFGFEPEALLSALGMDTWREFYVTLNLDEDASEARGGLTYSEPRGLVKLAAYGEGPPERPEFVTSRWATVSTAKFSLKEAYGALEEMLEAFNPAISGMVQGQIRKMNKDLGVDLKRDLVGSLGDNVVIAALTPPAPPAGAPIEAHTLQQVFAISLENPAAFTGALDAFRRSMGPNAETLFQTREYLGNKIVTFNPGGPQAAPSQKSVNYAIAKNTFFLSTGSAMPVEVALQGLAGKQPRLWEKTEVKAAWSRMPAGASAFQYQDVRAVIVNLFQTMSAAAAMMNNRSTPAEPDENLPEDAEPQPVEAPATQMTVDPTAQPDAETIAKYWGDAWGYSVRESTGIHSVYRIHYPE